MAVVAFTMEASLVVAAAAGAAATGATGASVVAGAFGLVGAVKPDTVADRVEPEAVSAVFSAVANSVAKPEPEMVVAAALAPAAVE